MSIVLILRTIIPTLFRVFDFLFRMYSFVYRLFLNSVSLDSCMYACTPLAARREDTVLFLYWLDVENCSYTGIKTTYNVLPKMYV